ncbi:MAG: EAL domain-containing protein [Bacteroidota bacterium]
MDFDETAQPNTSESQRRHAYLAAVMANMPQGISVFDENLRLRVWNPGFLDVLDLPAAAVHDGIHFSELVRIAAGRGEYGPGDTEEQVRQLTEQALKFEAHCFERLRPSGRTHLVQGEPLFIGGQLAGFITTYTDITERKVAENGLRQQHNLLQTVIDSIPSALSMFDKDQILALHNQAFLKLLDLPQSLLDDTPVTMEKIFRFNAERGEYGPGDPETLVASRLDRVAKRQPYHLERTRPSGKTLDIRGIPLDDGGLVTVYTDITERRASAEREQLAQKVFNHTPTGIIFTDEAHRILSINPATSQMTGYESYELLGHTVFALTSLPPELTPEVFHEEVARNASWYGEMEIARKSGESFPAGIRVSRVDDPHSGLPAHYIWILADITERREAEERMRHIAQHDPLTGLPNRLALLMRLAQLLPEARRHQWTLAIMFLDLDRFKIINDTLGHSIGDEMLREVAARLSRSVRESDMVARIGGDEFVILLPDIASAAVAATVAGKVLTAFANPITVDGVELHTSPSIGISIFPDDGLDGDTILKNADTAMYCAKAAGRNNYQFYAAEMNLAATERLDLERKLRQALLREEFALAFQPQLMAGDQRPVGVEALVRWHHPTDGVIPPIKFIPIAEETGLIVALGEWVLRTACHEMKRWLDAGLPPIKVAVNVSARQLRRRDFLETVAGALVESDLPPHLLELEVTESVAMDNPEESIRLLQAIRQMGVSIAIDDFGTGYSSLAYLKRLPIDYLKIDRSFVADIEHDLNDRAIAFGTIALAHSLGLEVIAEGVETEDQLELLRTNGCDEIQGYFFSPPLQPAAAFAYMSKRFEEYQE